MSHIHLLTLVTTAFMMLNVSPLSLAQPPTANVEIGQNPFRVEIKMFIDGDNQAVASHLILFSDGLVYDLDQTGETVTVFDLKRDRVILLDRKTQVRSTVSTDDLVKMTAQLKATAETKKLAEKLGMLCKVQFDEADSQYSVEFGSVRYTATTQQPQNELLAREFCQFADWASRLNIARSVGLPPFGRMALNQQLAADGKIPLEMSLQFKHGIKTNKYRSTHDFIPQISGDDRNQINEVGNMLALYRDVPLKAFP